MQASVVAPSRDALPIPNDANLPQRQQYNLSPPATFPTIPSFSSLR